MTDGRMPRERRIGATTGFTVLGFSDRQVEGPEVTDLILSRTSELTLSPQPLPAISSSQPLFWPRFFPPT